MHSRKDAAYLERNKVVAALARCFPSGIATTAIEGWHKEWHGCVYIDLPTGQVSWHFHDSHAYLFEGLPPYTKPWDGHTTEEKYERLAKIERDALKRQVEELKSKALAVRKAALEECYMWMRLYRSEYGALGLDYSHFMDWLQAQLDQTPS